MASRTDTSKPYSRVEFDRIRKAAKAAERRFSFVMASLSVTLGVAQLVFIKWADRHLSRETAVSLEAAVFLLYMAMVAWLIWRLERIRRSAAPHCPSCKAPMVRLSERVAAATGRCDSCGGQVVA